MAALHNVLTVAQTLSFALPPPTGPIVAAGIQIFDIFFGQSSGDSKEDALQKALKDALDAVKQDIENFMTENKLSDIQSDLRSMNDWIAESQQSLKKAQGQAEEEAVLESVIKGADSLYSDDNPIEQALNKLVGLPTRGNDAYTFSLSAVEMYLNVLMSYICSLKFRCEMRNKLVDLASQSDGGNAVENKVDSRLIDLFADYDLFLGRLEYWTGDEKRKALGDWVAKIKKDRMALISDVQTSGHNSEGFTGPNLESHFFTDGGKTITTVTDDYAVYYTWQGRNRWTHYRFTCKKADIVKARDQYIAEQQKQTEIDLSFVDDVMKTITAQVNQIKVPAPAPTSAPRIVEWLDTNWQGAWRWNKEYEVRYGMAFGNTAGQSEVKWGEWTPSAGDDRKCPKLQLPTEDPKGVVDARYIKREMRTNGPGDVHSKTVVLSEKTSTTYVDIDPARGDAACPDPSTPPLIDSWARTYAQPNKPDAGAPAWPSGYAVRYRYRYQNKAGVSLYPSVWAFSNTDAAQLDGENYANGGSQYLARIKIHKDPNASGYKLYRQFKGSEETETTGTIDDKGRYVIFTDSGL
jgi:hypothetical protein